MPTEETEKCAGNSSEVANQEAHDTGTDEWVAMPTGPGCILSTMEQVPWEGLGQELNAIHSTLPDDHTVSGTEWMEIAL